MENVDSKDRRERLIRWLQTDAEPESLAGMFNELREMRRLWLEEVVARTEGRLNGFLAREPSTAYADKTQLCRSINAELSSLNLAIRCPKSGRPAILVGNHGYDPNVGRFQLNISLPTGGRRTTLSSNHLPNLQLMPEPMRPASEKELFPPNNQNQRNR